MKEYLDILKDVRNNGVRKHNRTGIDTFSMSGAMFKYDMSSGRFPLLTTKKMPPKCIFAELEFFIRGITDKKWLENRKCFIWSDWCNPEKVPYASDPSTLEKMRNEPDLGLIYGYNWNNWTASNQIVTVERRMITDDPVVDNKSNNELRPSIDGHIYKSNEGVEFIIIADEGNCNDDSGESRHYVSIQFIESRYIMEHVRRDVAYDGRVHDVYFKTYQNIGYDGEGIDGFITLYSDAIYRRVRKVWSHMIDRCYNPSAKEYKYYGLNGITVSSRWHNFSLFLHDISQLTGWADFLRNPSDYELDKDYYGSNMYSRYTCVWLPHQQNVLYRDGRAFWLIDPTGGKHLYISKTLAGLEHGLLTGKLSAVLLGKRKHTKHYKAEYLNDGKLYRYQLPVNQLKNAIETLKTNPTDRRMLVMAWNPSILDKMALPPCHFGFQLISDGEKLDLCWFQRSVDTFLGLPFNIASYAMLLLLIAKETGLKPGMLVGHLDDVHIYENHLDAVDEQLSRIPKDLPVLNITNWSESIWDWSYTDFTLDNYDPWPTIKAPIAV